MYSASAGFDFIHQEIALGLTYAHKAFVTDDEEIRDRHAVLACRAHALAIRGISIGTLSHAERADIQPSLDRLVAWIAAIPKRAAAS